MWLALYGVRLPLSFQRIWPCFDLKGHVYKLKLAPADRFNYQVALAKRLKWTFGAVLCMINPFWRPYRTWLLDMSDHNDLNHTLDRAQKKITTGKAMSIVRFCCISCPSFDLHMVDCLCASVRCLKLNVNKSDLSSNQQRTNQLN